MSPGIQFLDLPTELLIRVLSLLSLPDIFACQSANRLLQDLVRDTTALQYCIACQAAGVCDNVESTVPLAERLAMLKRREQAWAQCQIVARTRLPIASATSMFDVADGLYITGKDGIHEDGRPRARDLQYLLLSHTEQGPSLGDPPWIRIGVTENFFVSNIIHEKIATPEHDLLAIATLSKTHRHHKRGGRIDVILLEMSSGEYHPLALQPKFFVAESQHNYVPYDIEIEIAGDHLSVFLRIEELESPARVLYLFNWKTGELKATLDAVQRTYCTIVFLTEDVLLLPNKLLNSLDLVCIPPSTETLPTPHQLTVSTRLYLPQLAPDVVVFQNFCSVTPSFAGRSKPIPTPNAWSKRHPYSCASADSIIAFHLAIEHTNTLRRTFCVLVMHARVLLAYIPTRNSSPPNSATGLSPPSQEAAVAEQEQDDDFLGPLPGLLALEWASWGPPVSRWLDTEGVANLWITSAWGQRYAQISALPGPSPIRILDFNPYHVRRCLSGVIPLESPTATLEVRVGQEQLVFADVFAEEVWSELPYVQCTSKATFDYHDLMMDERAIVGLHTDQHIRVCQVETLYFG